MRDVLIVGVSTRAAAASAARAGFRVTALDAFGDLDQAPGVRALSMARDIGAAFDPPAVASVASRIAADSVIYLSPFENHPHVVRALAGGVPNTRILCGNSPAVLRRARDPRTVAEVLARHGVATPRTLERAPSGSGVDNCDWLSKPRASGGGHGITPWQPGDTLPSRHYLQERIEGSPGSITFIAAGGRIAPLGLTRQIIGDDAFGAGGFRYCGSILEPLDGPGFTGRTRLSRLAREAAAVAARELGLVGANGIDFVERDGMPQVIEINPRYTASMELVERATGFSVIAAHIAACTHATLSGPAPSREPRVVGKAIVFARHDVTCGDTRPWLDDSTVRDVPHPGERVPAGKPVCTVFAEGGDTADCYEALVRRAALVYESLDAWASVTA